MKKTSRHVKKMKITSLKKSGFVLTDGRKKHVFSTFCKSFPFFLCSSTASYVRDEASQNKLKPGTLFSRNGIAFLNVLQSDKTKNKNKYFWTSK